MKRVLAVWLMLLLGMMPVMAEGFAQDMELPMANQNRAYSQFFRTEIVDEEAAKNQMCRYGSLPLLATSYMAKGNAEENWTILPVGDGWGVLMNHYRATQWMWMNREGQVLQYSILSYGAGNMRAQGMPYTGEMPKNTQEAILSYIERFAEINGLGEVSEYQQGDVTTLGGYALEVNSTARLGAYAYRFTTRLDLMAFSYVECLDVPLELTGKQMETLLMGAMDVPQDPIALKQGEPAPTQTATTQVPIPTMESYSVTVNGETYTIFAVDKHETGSSVFDTGKGRNLLPQEVLALAMNYTMEYFDVDARELAETAVVEYGYLEDKNVLYLDGEAVHAQWQVDFFGPDGADCLYELRIRDEDGLLVGIWGPNDGNG